MNIFIQVGSPEYEGLLIEAALAGREVALKEAAKKDSLLTQDEAMEMLRIKSKHTMKHFRETSGIICRKLGGEYRYSRRWVEDWINRG